MQLRRKIMAMKGKEQWNLMDRQYLSPALTNGEDLDKGGLYMVGGE